MLLPPCVSACVLTQLTPLSLRPITNTPGGDSPPLSPFLALFWAAHRGRSSLIPKCRSPPSPKEEEEMLLTAAAPQIAPRKKRRSGRRRKRGRLTPLSDVSRCGAQMHASQTLLLRPPFFARLRLGTPSLPPPPTLLLEEGWGETVNNVDGYAFSSSSFSLRPFPS